MTDGELAEVTPLTGRTFVWKERATWFPHVEAWLKPLLYKGRQRKFLAEGPRDNPQDDPDWLDFLSSISRVDAEDLTGFLADDLMDVTLRTYHGCRVEDAGVFHREGIRINDPATLSTEARRIVMEDERLAWMRPKIDKMIAEFDSRERDTGRVYICADDRPQLDDCGHYCLYGSEWIQVILGWSAHEVLRSRGVPTMVELNLPLHMVSDGQRTEFARRLLQEWIHASTNKTDWTPDLDFTFVLRRDIPPSWVVGHQHPGSLYDVFHRVRRGTVDTSCPYCRNAQ